MMGAMAWKSLCQLQTPSPTCYHAGPACYACSRSTAILSLTRVHQSCFKKEEAKRARPPAESKRRLRLPILLLGHACFISTRTAWRSVFFFF